MLFLSSFFKNGTEGAVLMTVLTTTDVAPIFFGIVDEFPGVLRKFAIEDWTFVELLPVVVDGTFGMRGKDDRDEGDEEREDREDLGAWDRG